jgi:histidinol phosphatase-like PHP family hydrolase
MTVEAVKEKLFDLITDMSEAELTEVVDFIGYLKLIKRGKADWEEIRKAIEDSEEFWRDEK